MSMHRLPERTRGRKYRRLHNGETTNPIDTRALIARLRAEESGSRAIATPPRRSGRQLRAARPAAAPVLLTTSARRHLAAVAVFLFLAMAGAFTASAADEWRNERNTTGYLKTCISCHGRVSPP